MIWGWDWHQVCLILFNPAYSPEAGDVDYTDEDMSLGEVGPQMWLNLGLIYHTTALSSALLPHLRMDGRGSPYVQPGLGSTIPSISCHSKCGVLFPAFLSVQLGSS